ncbi:MAG: high-potential iron-sulfur protein [Gammaproteobacteria bacterium]|nr:high-potential iron-sulfur protein [Gammaproteobacteria bacterium]
MQDKISRRTLIKGGILAGACVPALGLIAKEAAAAGLPPLSPSDPTAVALGFEPNTAKVDDKKYPTHKATQKCATCAQFLGKPGQASGGCNIFAGHSVPANGWCSAWAQKP